ncbi:MAG: alpha/beta hydrolase-fold protein, partial [Myxococcota bacterium]
RWPSGTVPNYTQRRVLRLLEWVLDTFPADPNRVAIAGASMGGAGALALGLMYGRHFAVVESTIGQTISRNHRPSRIAQLSRLWGSPRANLPDGHSVAPLGVWDRLDMVRALAQSQEARNQFVFSHHGKDDPIIHFGAVVFPSPALGLSFYDALQVHRVGHYAVWDEGGHGTPDPILGPNWWDDGWRRLTDPTTFLRRNLAFAAFSNASSDDDAGQGGDSRPFHPEQGYAGRWMVPGDTGWSGAAAGIHNRGLRWDSRTIVDRIDRFEASLFVAPERRGPKILGLSPTRDTSPKAAPVVVDVTPRRTQHFRPRPHERIRWRFGDQDGYEYADEFGTVTVLRLSITPKPQRLILGAR